MGKAKDEVIKESQINTGVRKNLSLYLLEHVHRIDGLYMQPFGVVCENRELFISYLLQINSWEIMTDKNQLLPEILVVFYFPVFDKFTSWPLRISMT